MESAGLGGSIELGKHEMPVGGADMGILAEYGLGGTMRADPGGEGSLLLPRELGGEVSALSVPSSSLDESSDLSLTADVGAESGLRSPGASPGARAGELSDMAFDRKSA